MRFIYFFILIIFLVGLEIGIILPLLPAPFSINLLLLLVVIFVYENDEDAMLLTVLAAVFTELRSTIAPGLYFSAYLVVALLIPYIFSKIFLISRPLGYLALVCVGTIIFVDLWTWLGSWLLNRSGIWQSSLSFISTLRSLPLLLIFDLLALYPLYAVTSFLNAKISNKKSI